MADVLAPPVVSDSPSPSSPQLGSAAHDQPSEPPASLLTARDPRRLPRERIPSFAPSRKSTSSHTSSRSHSRPRSAALAHQRSRSSLRYAAVRDFAYPPYHPMYHGPPPTSHSRASESASERNSGIHLPGSGGDGHNGEGGRFDGMWDGEGAVGYHDGHGAQEVDSLPSTAYGAFADDDLGDIDPPYYRGSRHRKTRSRARIDDVERGRRRQSGNQRIDSDMYYFSGGQPDAAGREALRQSRGYTGDNGSARRDSHFASTLPTRSYHTAQTVNLESDLPLDSEPVDLHHSTSPQRASMGPEDEELYYGESLALYSFEPENSNELRLVEGQIVVVSYRHGQGWLVASDPATGEQGLIPEAYVRLVRNIENWDHERGGFIEDDETSPEEEEEEEEEEEGEERTSPQDAETVDHDL